MLHFICVSRWNMFISERAPQISRFMGPTWGPPGANMTQVGPMLVPWTLLSGAPTAGHDAGGWSHIGYQHQMHLKLKSREMFFDQNIHLTSFGFFHRVWQWYCYALCKKSKRFDNWVIITYGKTGFRENWVQNAFQMESYIASPLSLQTLHSVYSHMASFVCIP